MRLSLSEAQQEVFLMNRIDYEKKYREIAELLDISQKAVEKNVVALKILKAHNRKSYNYLIYSRVNRIEVVLYI
jgi:DNA-directed RNA polymerase specialized sigma24 family protein